MTKTILVTGANRGIGAELTSLLTKRGDTVIALGRDRAALEDHPGPTIHADLNEPGSLATAVAHIDRLDVIVHCAGIAHAAPVEYTDVDSWRDHLTVNTIAPAELTRALLPALRASRGLVLFVNSGAGMKASPMFAAYAASKHALKALADALRDEERQAGVRVSTIYPGIVDTRMQHELR
ncbi:SDR family NAD(P)-dependent oxidoreductase, partial [Stackebrandtia soli]|uniref:SDR family NAD(P)-dependent oxidoreductase n=1 Tax=Stackebrandtia soli TaxID=1892856 RepID=UPI0039E827F0